MRNIKAIIQDLYTTYAELVTATSGIMAQRTMADIALSLSPEAFECDEDDEDDQEILVTLH